MLILDMFNNYQHFNGFNKFDCKRFINMEVIYEIYFVDVEISLLRYATQNTSNLKPLIMLAIIILKNVKHTNDN